MLTDEKKAKVKEVMSAINKSKGKGTIALATKHSGIRMVRQRTGILSFDILSGGGMVKNSMNLLYGKRSQGKSTLALHAIAEAQRRGEVCAYVYSEGVIDENHLVSCGVNLDDLLLTLTNESEEAVDVVQTLAQSRAVDYIVVDSGQGLIPKRILEVAAQQHVGVEAYFIGQMTKKFTAATTIKQMEAPWCTFTLISQGTEPHGGGLLYPKGGDIQQFFAVQMIEIAIGNGLTVSGTEISEHAKRVGHQMFFKFRKNKTFPPYKAGMVNYYIGETDFGCGRGDIDHIFDTVVCGVKYGVFTQGGAWISYTPKGPDGEPLELVKYQGKPAFSNWLRSQTPEQFKALRDEIYVAGLKQESAVVEQDSSFEAATEGSTVDLENEAKAISKEKETPAPPKEKK